MGSRASTVPAGARHDRRMDDEGPAAPTPPDHDPQDPFELRDDPGWKPWGRREPDGLVALRFVFVQFSVALLLVGVVVAFLVSDAEPYFGPWSKLPAALAVCGVGLLSLALVRWVPVRLDCSDELALARTWRARFFARMAASELAALAGFVAVLGTDDPRHYALGLLFCAIGFAVSGPTRANLIRDQERLALDGCPIALMPALRHQVNQHTR